MIRRLQLPQSLAASRRFLVILLVVAGALALGGSTATAKGGKGYKGKKGHWHAPHAHGPQVVQVVYAPAAGTIRVKNPTSFAFALQLDGSPVGTLAPGQTLVLPNVSAGPRQIQTRVLGMPSAPHSVQTAYVKPHRTTKVRLEAPIASLVVRNQQPIAVTVRVDGQQRATLGPGQRIRIDGLVAGAHRVEMFGPYGLVAGRQMHFDAGRDLRWAPPAALGTLSFRNGAMRGVTVTVQDGRSAHVQPGGVVKFAGLPMGAQVVRVSNHHGQSRTQSVSLRPNQVTSWTFVPPSGHHKGHKKGGKHHGSEVAWVY